MEILSTSIHNLYPSKFAIWVSSCGREKEVGVLGARPVKGTTRVADHAKDQGARVRGNRWGSVAKFGLLLPERIIPKGYYPAL